MALAPKHLWLIVLVVSLTSKQLVYCELSRSSPKTQIRLLNNNIFAKRWVTVVTRTGAINKALNKDSNKPTASSTNQTGRTTSITIPYHGDLSEKLKRIYRDHGITTHFKPTNTIRQSLVHPKDKQPKGRISGVVYGVRCSEEQACQDSYIGETAQPLHNRMLQHRRASSAPVDVQTNPGIISPGVAQVIGAGATQVGLSLAGEAAPAAAETSTDQQPPVDQSASVAASNTKKEYPKPTFPFLASFKFPPRTPFRVSSSNDSLFGTKGFTKPKLSSFKLAKIPAPGRPANLKPVESVPGGNDAKPSPGKPIFNLPGGYFPNQSFQDHIAAGETEQPIPEQGTGQPSQGSGQQGHESGQPSQGSDQPGQDSGKPGQGSGQPGHVSGQPGHGSGQPGDGSDQPSQDSGKPGQGSGQAGQESAQPSQGSGQPSHGSDQPSQDSGKPGQGSGQAGQESAQPSQGSGQPSQGSGEPSQDSGQPSQGSGQPSHGSGQPSHGLGQPSQGSGQPGQGSGQPSHGSGQPGQGSGQPSQGSDQPDQGSDQPDQGSGQPSQPDQGPGQPGFPGQGKPVIPPKVYEPEADEIPEQHIPSLPDFGQPPGGGRGENTNHNPLELTEAIEISNLIFTSLFALEMLLKIMALYGVFGYISNGFNVFDGVIVIVSITEIMQPGGNGGLSVLRTFRLMRILKLVRFMPALRRQLLVMLKTMDNVATFFSLLALFIFIFSVLGMHLFGCSFCKYVSGHQVCDRKNFDSLLWSIVTVFQILTQEDWNTVLYNGMYTTSQWAALYFIALMTFGNYVLFNLLVAILVEGFSAEDERKKEQAVAEKEALSSMEASQRQGMSGDESKTGDGKHEMISLASIKDSPDDKQLVANPVIDSSQQQMGSCLTSPPIITRTAATPMATPQGSPMCESPREFKGPFSDTQSIDSDSQSVSSLNISPRLPRIPSTQHLAAHKSVVSRTHPSDKNLLCPSGPMGLPVETDHNDHDSDGHSCISIGRRSSVDNSDHNGYLPDSDSRRTSIASCNGGSRRTSYISCNGGSFMAQLDTQIPFSEKESGSDIIEDPDALDEANCDCTKFLPEPKGCFKTREEYALYILSPHNKFRHKLQFYIAQKWFDYTILAIIFTNCVTLAMERPAIKPDSLERKFLNIANYIFMAIFTLEMLVKVLAKGFFIGKHAYLHSGWNIMDGCLVGISWIDVLISLVSSSSPQIFGILRVFRLLRTLRPLRVISRAPGLKLVVQTLLSSLKPIGNIVIICCTFFVIFGILGIQLFKGKFFYCDGPDIRMIRNRTQCEANPRNQWLNQQYNFDHLGQALMALFVLASRDGWVEIMYNGIDAVGIDQQPIRDYNEWLILYFISFLLIVGFFVLNMFVGVVVENFHKCRVEQEEQEFAERLEKRKLKIEKARQSIKCGTVEEEARVIPYYSSYSPYRLKVHDFVINKYFDLAIAGIIFLNVISMALEHYGMSLVLQVIMQYLNYIFTAIFIIEAFVKIVALGFKRYFKEKWNQLDMLIVVLSLVGIVLEEMESDVIPINPTIIRIMRVLRIARVLKIMKTMKGLRELLAVLMGAIPQVGNLGLLFFLLFFIFAALGVELFGKLDCTDDNPCSGLGRHATFKNFFSAFLTLFRIATGDNWNGIMKDTLRTDTCDDSASCEFNCCANPYMAPIFFVSFVLMAQFVLVNVVVAVLMKHLEESHKLEQEDEEDMAQLEAHIKADEMEARNGSDGEQETPFTPLLKPVAPSDIILTVGTPPLMHSNPASRQNIPRQMCHLQPCSAAKTLVTRVHSVPDNYQFRPPAYSTNATTADDKQDEDTGKSPAETSPSNIPALQLPLPQINLPSSSQESIPDAMATQGTMGNASISSMDSSTGKQLSQLSASPRDTFSSMSGGGGSGGHGSNGPNLTSSDSDRSAKTIVPKEQHHVPMSLTVPNNPLIQIQEPIDDKDTKPPQREDVSLPNYRPYSSDSSEELKRLARSESEEETRKSVDSRHKCSPTKGVKKHRRRASGSPRNCSSSGGSHSVSPAPSRSSSDSDEQAATSPQKRKKNSAEITESFACVGVAYWRKKRA
ncbi:voltage-dependent T-type calcium channel subunit alpha-1G-like [Amphiura filiformis]|uniref:voltage-dependent T-type calcium channel subunit alpha-1G-like n=1 Tax=Amphiura filiformis TaxID=82378 RepID=UPI003B21782B